MWNCNKIHQKVLLKVYCPMCKIETKCLHPDGIPVIGSTENHCKSDFYRVYNYPIKCAYGVPFDVACYGSVRFDFANIRHGHQHASADFNIIQFGGLSQFATGSCRQITKPGDIANFIACPNLRVIC